jgi:uncharacterized protein YndB with AHSA1/START domain
MTLGDANAVVIERTFDAPVQIVWQLWTDPTHFREWFGPTGVTVPVAELDVRVGGRRLVGMEMQTPDGPRRMWLAGEFRDIVEHERLVYTEFVADEDGNQQAGAGPADVHATTEVRVEFEAVGERTNMRLTHVGIPSDSPGATGWTMAFEKLAELVRTTYEATG